MTGLTTLIEGVLKRRSLTLTLASLCLFFGALTAPFEALDELSPALKALRSPVRVDALPPLGENQQVLVASWEGRAPEEVEEQLTYPLSVAILGATGVKAVRSASTFGLSTLYVIFEEGVGQGEARARLIEQLAALPDGALPEGVSPKLGPDATALGQIFWYHLEPYDPSTGEAVGGWPLEELRALQDDVVRYALARVEGVAEVSSVGGYVRRYEVQANPHLLERYGLTLGDLTRATREAHLDVGAGALELNGVEHLARGVGQLGDIDNYQYLRSALFILRTRLSSSKRAEREPPQRALSGALGSESGPDPLRDAKRRSVRALRLFNYREILVNDIEWDMIGDLLLDSDHWQVRVTLHLGERRGKSKMSTE